MYYDDLPTYFYVSLLPIISAKHLMMIQDIQPHQFSNTYNGDATVTDQDYLFYFSGRQLLFINQNGQLQFPKKKDLIDVSAETTYLFSLDNVNCFWIKEQPDFDKNTFLFVEINSFQTKEQKEIDWCSAVAYQLVNWYRQHQFCGVCGQLTQINTNERVISCAKCETSVYPTISPAIIVAIVSGDKILLAKGAHFKNNMYSLVAGYVDVGESIEDAVKREVKEEVGIDVYNIRYYKSQPWPFSGSMMIGFIANADDKQTIKVDNVEIVDAAWYSRDSLPHYPPLRSIAGELIEHFINDTLH